MTFEEWFMYIFIILFLCCLKMQSEIIVQFSINLFFHFIRVII